MLQICIILKAFWQHKIDTKKYFQGWNCHNFKVNLTFCPQIFALLCRILSRRTFSHFSTFMSKKSQHDRVKPREGGGPRAVYTMCKKTSDLVANGFPELFNYSKGCLWFVMSLNRNLDVSYDDIYSCHRLPILAKREYVIFIVHHLALTTDNRDKWILCCPTAVRH